MDSNFDERESLLRAVYPPTRRPDFWRNGRLSSAALKDKKGLSVIRTYDRTVRDSVDWMKRHFTGAIVAVKVSDCNAVQAFVKYCPSHENQYHSEIHGSKTEAMLSDYQALTLARRATMEYRPNFEYSI